MQAHTFICRIQIESSSLSIILLALGAVRHLTSHRTIHVVVQQWAREYCSDWMHPFGIHASLMDKDDEF
jgi:hypothetical protein